MNLRILRSCRLIFALVLVGSCIQLNGQQYFKKYIDSESNCDDFNTQVLNKQDSIYLINFVDCEFFPYRTNILQIDLKGNLIKTKTIEELINNINSGHLYKEKLFIAGVNNDEIPDSKLVLWEGSLNLESDLVVNRDLLDPPIPIYLNSMGSVNHDTNKVLYGQYQIDNNPKVFSYILWLDQQFLRDSIIIFDTTYDWTIISDATLDLENNLVVLIDAAKVVDHITYYYRIIKKYNVYKEEVFEWVSNPVGFIDGVSSIAVIDTNVVIIEFFAEENGHVHSLIAIDKEGNQVWEHIFHLEDPFSLYRINDFIATSSGDILACGTYRNVSQDIIETGYVCKLNKVGQLLWERIFFDREEVDLPESGINKVIHFNSIVEMMDHSIVIGGRVIHKFLTPESLSDVLLMVLDSTGCIFNDCSVQQDITRIGDFLDGDKTWTEGYGGSDSWSLKFSFDTIPVQINGNIYFELLQAYSEFSQNWASTGIYLRSEDGRVYEHDGAEQIIYDFNLVEGDTFHLGNEIIVHDLVVENVDTISLMSGDLKKRWILQPINPVDPNNDNTVVWIEGIGNLKGLRTNRLPWTFDWEPSSILCVYWMNSIVYDNPAVDSCWLITTSTKEEVEYNYSIVPNPATEEIRIIGIQQNIESVKIYNNLGVLVVTSESNIVQLNNNPPGYYYIAINIKGAGVFTKAFIKR